MSTSKWLVIGLISLSLLTSRLLETTLSAQNWRLPTWGGTQWWTDHLVYAGWRIQQHAGTGHYRLLDDSDVRQTYGNWKLCWKRFQELRQEKQLTLSGKTAIVTLHGMGRSRGSMEGLCQHVADKAGWVPVNMSYSSTRKNVEEHALALRHVLSHLDGVTEVHLVGHSLGNLVIRHFLNDQKQSPTQGLPKVGRIVMLAPPNGGAAMARLLQDNVVYELVAGKSGQQLGESWDDLQRRLAVPEGEFGIIAGSTRDGRGMNPLVRGDDDLIVSVEETKLPGAHDFLVVSSIHTTIMQRDDVKKAVRRFLQTGAFLASGQRTALPIPPAQREVHEQP